MSTSAIWLKDLWFYSISSEQQSFLTSLSSDAHLSSSLSQFNSLHLSFRSRCLIGEKKGKSYHIHQEVLFFNDLATMAYSWRSFLTLVLSLSFQCHQPSLSVRHDVRKMDCIGTRLLKTVIKRYLAVIIIITSTNTEPSTDPLSW